MASATFDIYAPSAVATYQGNWLNDSAVHDAANVRGLPAFTFGEVDSNRYWIASGSLYQPKTWSQLAFEPYLGSRGGTDLVKSGGHRAREIAEELEGTANRYSQQGCVPTDLRRWLSETRSVAYYTSNNADERYGFDSFWDARLGTQFECLGILAREAQAVGVRLIVRVHPNLAAKSPNEVKRWLEVLEGLDNVAVIPAGSDISSLELSACVDVNYTFSSNVAQSIAMTGRPIYSFAKGTYFRSYAIPVLDTLEQVRASLNTKLTANEEETLVSRSVAWHDFLRDNFYRFHDERCPTAKQDFSSRWGGPLAAITRVARRVLQNRVQHKFLLSRLQDEAVSFSQRRQFRLLLGPEPSLPNVARRG